MTMTYFIVALDRLDLEVILIAWNPTEKEQTSGFSR